MIFLRLASGLLAGSHGIAYASFLFLPRTFYLRMVCAYFAGIYSQAL
ncbi:hypothetical protein AB1S67_18130 [Saccharophagus degradans]